jgi:ferritin-like metal-binding protein YciE
VGDRARDRRKTSAFDWYVTGIEGLLDLETEHRRLLPDMISLVSCHRLREYLEDRAIPVQRQMRRLELLLRASADRQPARKRMRTQARAGVSATMTTSMAADLAELRLVRDTDERDAELVNASMWIANLKLEQYEATRSSAERIGLFEATGHLERSLDAESAASQRLLRISERMFASEMFETEMLERVAS